MTNNVYKENLDKNLSNSIRKVKESLSILDRYSTYFKENPDIDIRVSIEGKTLKEILLGQFSFFKGVSTKKYSTDLHDNLGRPVMGEGGYVEQTYKDEIEYVPLTYSGSLIDFYIWWVFKELDLESIEDRRIRELLSVFPQSRDCMEDFWYYYKFLDKKFSSKVQDLDKLISTLLKFRYLSNPHISTAIDNKYRNWVLGEEGKSELKVEEIFWKLRDYDMTSIEKAVDKLKTFNGELD